MDFSLMGIFSILFVVLFIFIGFVFLIYLISLFIKKKKYIFEPNVSIVIPSYNEGKNIIECLESVFNSDYPKEKMEVIVVDDGSTDNTLELIKRYKEVKTLRQKHQGKSEALNTGVKNASFEFVLTIDADTTIGRNCVREIVKPFENDMIGATTGTSIVKNKYSFIGIFQNIEYHYNNLIRSCFSRVFENGIWFFGALACYRKDLLKKIGYFKKHTLTEDMDIALEIRSAGFKTLHVTDAVGYTITPLSLISLYKQRARWWVGTLQALIKNKHLFSIRESPSILFLFINQFWWSFYSLISLPIIIYQIYYWLPYNTSSLINLFYYLFRWFSLLGPIYVVYKLPLWGFSFYNFFGVMSGLISSFMIIVAIRMFKDKLTVKNLFGLFFYFPYTIVLNIIISLCLLKSVFLKKKYFISD